MASPTLNRRNFRSRGFPLTPIGAAVLLVITGCAATPNQNHAALATINSGTAQCAALIASIDRAATAAGVTDGGTAKIAGFTHLRIDRFAALLARNLENTHPSGAQLAQWWRRSTGLGKTAVKIEAGNLAGLIDRPATQRRLDNCFVKLADNPGSTDHVTRAIALARVPDDYSLGQRVLGLYPLTAPLITMGFNSWKRNNLKNFADHPVPSPRERTRTYAPPSPIRPLDAEGVARIVKGASDNPLKIPRPSQTDLNRLFDYFAPVYKIQTRSPNDRIVTPIMMGPAGPVLDRDLATVYVRTSYAVFDNTPVLQLIYQIWFPARPSRTALLGLGDILAGELDGLIWRVTLGRDGRVVAYDSIHPCGCYHLFFPVPPTQLKPHRDEPGEGTPTPAPGPSAAPGHQTVLAIAPDSHYLTGVFWRARSNPSEPYGFAPMSGLRTLPRPASTGPGSQRQSLYGPDGIVAGTDRSERYLLWPAGIARPGAMRQWGRHPTAFVGRRHFDDPALFKNLFERP